MSADEDEVGGNADAEADEYEQTLFEPESIGTESESDLADVKDLDFRDVVLAPSDWTVQTILSQLNSDSFELDPDFQRRNAWSDLRKSKFIESLMLGLPIPQIVLAERDEDEADESEEARYVVIDGKQRLLALEAFYAEQNALVLTGLTVLKHLNGLTRQDIVDDSAVARMAKRLANRTIRTVVIRRYPNESFLHLVFHRINHQTLPLSAQELRQALEPGPFTKFADRQAGASHQLHRVLGATQMPDFRMRDVELLVRFVAFKTRIDSYRGNLKKFLDETCRVFNKRWTDVEQGLALTAESLNLAIETTETIFGEHAFRRFTEEQRWEGRFNRAVFDVMCYYFSEPHISAVALRYSTEVVTAYEALSVDDPRFGRSLASTTKTLPATIYRLEAWGRELAEALDTPLRGPVLDERTRTVRIEELGAR